MTEPAAQDIDLPPQPEGLVEQRREPVFNIPAVVAALIAACVSVHLVRIYLLSFDQDLELLFRTAFIPIRYSGQFPLDIYGFTSLFTYALLHGGLAHLAINMIWLAAFGSPLANRLGAARFLAFWAVTSVAAVALHFVLHRFDHSPLVGASGAISGMMGAAARFGFRIDRSSGRAGFAGPVLPVRQVLRSRNTVVFLSVWMIINLVTGLVGFGAGGGSQIAWEAHIGGFLAGFFLIGRFTRSGRSAAPPALN